MPKFFNSDMADLTHQLVLSPRRLRLEQFRGIEILLDLIDPKRAYPFDFVCFHITKYRKTDSTNSFAIPGKALLCDLVTMAEVLSRRSKLTASELDEPYETHPQLAERLQVSTKTVRRWRTRGLLGLRVIFEDGVNRLAFCRRAVDRFVARNTVLVAKGASFRQLTAEERDRIIDRAREILAQARMKLHAVAKQIAEETGRAVETVRYTLRRHDESAESVPLFRHRTDSEGCERSAEMWRRHLAGESLETIAAALLCTVEFAERTLRRLQIQKWQSAPPEFVPHELFDAPNAEALILDVAEPEPAPVAAVQKMPRDLPAYLRALYAHPLLSAALEQDLFRRYNYLKYQAAKLLRAVSPETVTTAQVAAIRDRLAQAESVRTRIIQANLRLVVSITKKHVGWSDRFYEVISDGNMSLMRAIEKFDFSLGNKFSTYASWAIIKNFARSIPEDHYVCRRFVTGQEEVLEAVADHRPEVVGEADRKHVREMLAEGLKRLSERERDVVAAHFGLEGNGVVLTLEQIGRKFGITKERVRQIEQQAIVQLRSLLAPDLADSLEP